MTRTKKLGSKRKKTKKGVAGKFDNRYFKKLDKKSVVVKNMINNLGDKEDFKGFIIDLPAKYFKDLSTAGKREVFDILLEYLETNDVVSIDKFSGDAIIGAISIARLLEIKDLFKKLVYQYVKKFNSKLKKNEKGLILKLANLTHPDDLIVKETFVKTYYLGPTIFNLFDDFISYSITNDVNHVVIKRLFNMGFNVRREYSESRDIRVRRSEEMKSVIEKGSIHLFRILVENGRRDTKIEIENCHMLNWAVFFNRLDIVKYLIEKEKHNINATCMNFLSFPPKPEDGTPLYNAVLIENIEIVKYLIKKGANLNLDVNGIDGETAAFAAVNKNNFEILKILVEAGADLDTQTEQGELAYEKAIEYKNQEMIDYLVEHGARTVVNEEEIIPDSDPE